MDWSVIAFMGYRWKKDPGKPLPASSVHLGHYFLPPPCGPASGVGSVGGPSALPEHRLCVRLIFLPGWRRTLGAKHFSVTIDIRFFQTFSGLMRGGGRFGQIVINKIQNKILFGGFLSF